MRTLKQQQTSRSNGAKSKGPVTPEGKARVSQNGTTHGIHSQRVVLEGEDPDAFRTLRDSLVRDWAPVTAFELHLVIDIAEARWRLARFTSLETAAIDYQVNLMRPDINETWPAIDPGTRHILAFNELITRNRSLEVLQTAIRHQHRIIDRATAQLLQLRKIRPEQPAPEQPQQPATQIQQTKPEPAPTPALSTPFRQSFEPVRSPETSSNPPRNPVIPTSPPQMQRPEAA